MAESNDHAGKRHAKRRRALVAKPKRKEGLEVDPDTNEIVSVDPEIHQKTLEKMDLMSILTCGDAGGVARFRVKRRTPEGDEFEQEVDDSCDSPSSFGIPGARYGITPGRCYRHTTDELPAKAILKATFLEKYLEAPRLGLDNAAEVTGVTLATIYLWVERDAEFRTNFSYLRTITEAMLVDGVEEATIRRMSDEKNGADTIRALFLINRRADKWKTAGKVHESHAAAAAAASFSGGKHVHVYNWKMGDQILPFSE